MTLFVLILFFLSVAFVFWSCAHQSLAIDEYRATQMTPVVPVGPIAPEERRPIEPRRIDWIELDTGEYEEFRSLLDAELLRDQERWSQAREWLDEILVDVRDGALV